MPSLRSETLFHRTSLIASEAIDTSDYDRAGRFTTDAEAALCSANETAQFLFLEDASIGEPVSVAFLGMGQVQLKLSGSGSKGQKISCGASGILVAGTAASLEPDEDDLGVALSDWSDGDEVEVFVFKGSKL